jgi:Bacterial transcriptional activator domain
MKTKTAETELEVVAILSANGRRGGQTATPARSAAMVVGSRVASRMIPTDVRSLLLLAGYAGMLIIGLVNVVEADNSGLVLVAAGLAGAAFVHDRLLNIGIWLGVLVFGLSAVAGHDLRGLVPIGLGLVGAIVGAWPDATMVEGLRSRSVEADVPADADEPEEVGAPPALTIRSIGRLELLAGDKDLAPELLSHRVLSFIWLFLLVRVVTDGDPRVDRAALADEVSPRLDPQAQRQRFRGQLRDLQKLEAAISDRVVISGELVGLDLGHCDFDIDRLKALDEECRAAGILPARLQRRAAKLLAELGSGLFLPGWEELEHRVTGGRGGAAEVVNAARRQVADHRANVAAALAETLVAAGRTAEAIAPLEDAMAGAPHREDVIRLLISAYLRTGQTAKAKSLQAEFGVKEKA